MGLLRVSDRCIFLLGSPANTSLARATRSRLVCQRTQLAPQEQVQGPIAMVEGFVLDFKVIDW